MELSVQVRKERNQFIPIYYLFTKKKMLLLKIDPHSKRAWGTLHGQQGESPTMKKSISSSFFFFFLNLSLSHLEF